MNKVRLAGILFISLLFATAAHTLQSQHSTILEKPDTQAQVERSFGQLPLLFVENQGQWDEQVAYAVQGSDKTLYFTAEGVTFALSAPTDDEEENVGKEAIDFRMPLAKPSRTEQWTVKLDFLGANSGAAPRGQEQDEAVISYFTGQPEEWNAGLSTYRRLVYSNLWPGIDLVYEGTVSRLKYHFLVHPGADPNQIRLAYRGASDVTLNAAGQLVIETPLGRFEDDTPVAYQEIDGERVLVNMAYVLESAESDSQPYHFALGNYDPALPLILDPVILVYSGFIGGRNHEDAQDIAVDADGNAYVVGRTASLHNSFPATVGPDLTYNSNTDAFIAKVNATGTGLVYAGYIGGKGYEDAWAVAVDGEGSAYVTGQVSSTEATFPVTVGPDLTYNGGEMDIFIAKVNPTGDALDYAGYIGGDNSERGFGIAVNSAGNAYLTGQVGSTEDTFPVTVGPDLTYNGSFGDIFVVKVNLDGTGLDYAGYIGGDGYDTGWAITLDDAENVFIAGSTTSTEATFPVLIGPDLTFNSPWDHTYGDAVVAKVNPAGTGLLYAGYIGGATSEEPHGIAVDENGSAYIVGRTDSTEVTFPVTVGPDLTFNGGIDDGFIAKVNPAGDGLVYAGYIGGADYDAAEGIAVDGAGNSYITGRTNSSEATFPVIGGPDLTYNGGFMDAYVAMLNPDGTGFVYAGYIGGDNDDRGVGLARDESGSIYIAGITDSSYTSFPTLVGPKLRPNGRRDAFITKIELEVSP